MCGSDIFLGILAVFFPPVAVWIKRGVCTADSLINIALCCLAYVPGLLHAWYIILTYPEPEYDEISYDPISPGAGGQRRDAENGHVTYYYVAHGPIQHPCSPGQSQVNYGTVGAQPSPQAQGQQQRGEGAAGAASGQVHSPPTYAEAIKGDHKVQSQE